MVCNSVPTTIVNLPLAGIILMVDCRCVVGLKRNRLGPDNSEIFWELDRAKEMAWAG